MRLSTMVIAALVAAGTARADDLADAAKARAAGDNWAALRLLEPLANKGDAKAMVLLGTILRDGGGGVAANPGRGLLLIRRAAESGDVEAQRQMAEGYATGQGVGRSAFQAYYWLSVAAATAPAADRAAILKRRAELAGELTAGEEAQAQDMADARTGTAPAPAPTPAPAPPTLPEPVRLTPAPAPAPKPAETKPGRSAGSGFIVTADGKILTNAHVVPGCKSIQVTLPQGRSLPATLLAKDDKDDLALLDTDAADLDFARFRDGKPIRAGDGVVAVGFPLSSYLSREPNVTVGVVSALAGRNGDKRSIQITAPVQKGNSGGPLADMSGNIVGIVATKLDAMKIAERTGDLPQNVNFAIKAELAAKFLATHSVTIATAQPGPDQSAADVGDIVKKVTVFVTCEK